MESGWDQDVTKFFRKILNTISYGLIWLIAGVTAGIYFKLGIPEEQSTLVLIIFYTCLTIALIFLLRYFYKIWSK